MQRKGTLLPVDLTSDQEAPANKQQLHLSIKELPVLLPVHLVKLTHATQLTMDFWSFECSDLVNDLKEKYGKEKLTVQTNKKVKIDFENSSITFDGKEYSIDPVGEAAQELIVAGGLENWVNEKY